jgi:hypothetical protein
MQVIYETINLFNLENNILPYRYIGSQQNYTELYFGSNKELKSDIQRLGLENFSKKIIFKFFDLTNKELRDKESELLIEINAAKDKSYYNKTNTSHKGYIETEGQKLIRINKGQKTKKLKQEKLGYVIQPGSNNGMRGKKYFNVLVNKYGLEKAEEIKSKNSKLASDRIKLKNPAKKIINNELKEKINSFKNKTNKQISEILNINYWMVCRYKNKIDR